jgi:hypothetical protein
MDQKQLVSENYILLSSFSPLFYSIPAEEFIMSIYLSLLSMSYLDTGVVSHFFFLLLLLMICLDDPYSAWVASVASMSKKKKN